MAEYYFQTKQMTVGYQGVPLIREIEIRLKRGEILTLIGPNGAGKSTILKSITGQLQLIGGCVYLGGDLLAQMHGNELARRMAVVLTERLRTEMMTCADVVATGRYPYTGKFGVLSLEDRRITAEAMDLVHVTAIGDRDFTKISDGQRQRVMLARAICQEPEIIVLDEPTSYLDVRYKLDFLSVLQELKRKKNLSVIMSLHELDLAERVSDRILCVKGEYVEKFGTPEEIFVPGYINRLFDIHAGNYDDVSGNVELLPSPGQPEVFVIAGGGSGRNVFRRLQREGTAFAAGILFENDLDYPVAKALAAQTVAAKAFEPIGEELIGEAKRLIDRCSGVICCRDRFGELDRANAELLAYARDKVLSSEFRL